MVCSLHSVTTGSRDRANVSLIIIIIPGTTVLYCTVFIYIYKDYMTFARQHLTFFIFIFALFV